MNIDCADCEDRGWNLREGRIEPCQCGTYDPPKWVQRGDTPCLLDHFQDPNRPRRASTGWLCAGHYARLEQMIAELPSIYDDLTLALTRSEKPNSEGGKAKHSQVKGGVNLNGPIVECRHVVQLECWRMAHEVAEGAGIDPPVIDTVGVICGWLLGYTGWYAEQDDADLTFKILAELTRDARSLAIPSGRQAIEVTERTGRACETATTCDVVTHSEVRCGGSLRANLTGGGWEGDEGRLSCRRCGQERPITLVALADFGETA